MRSTDLFRFNRQLHQWRRGITGCGVILYANAVGRLLGTVLSGWLYQIHGLEACLWISSGLLLCAMLVSVKLKKLITSKLISLT